MVKMRLNDSWVEAASLFSFLEMVLIKAADNGKISNENKVSLAEIVIRTMK